MPARRRPTRDARALNLLAGDADVDRLPALGARLATALRRGDGEALRAAMADERRLVDALADRALALAAEEGLAPSRRAVAGALRAAVADREVARAIAKGQLVRAPDPATFPAPRPTPRAAR